MIKRIVGAHKGERGQVAIWVALFFFVFLGLIAIVADVGFWLNDRRSAQNQADALALAAAQELPDTTAATAIVYEWATANNMSAEEVQRIEFEDADGNACNSGCSLVRVFVHRNSEIFMAQVLGITDTTVTTKAAAIIKPLSGVCPFPWAIPSSQLPGASASNWWGLSPGTGFVFQDAKDLEIPENTPGNYGALALLGSGADVYKDTVSGVACEAGYDCKLKLEVGQECYDTLCGEDDLLLGPGDTLTCETRTKTGQMGSNTASSLELRYCGSDKLDEICAQAEICDAQTYTQSATIFRTNTACQDRMGAIFIIDAFPAGGSKPVQILGVAWFYISGWDHWSPRGNGETGAPPPADGDPESGYVWGYLTDIQAVNVWDYQSIANPYAPVVAVLVE